MPLCSGASYPIRILLAEDDPGHQCLLGLAMCDGRPHVGVTTVTNRSEFVEAIRGERFDCVVMDFNLVDCQADELLALLKNLHPTCPAIVISGSKEQEIVVRSVRNGSVDFVHKDDAVEGVILRDRIQVVLASSRRDQQERRRNERRIQHLTYLAEKDSLTGMFNRRVLDELLSNDSRRIMDRRGDFSLIMIDLDHFKAINDLYGHPAGDEVLQSAARIILQNLTPDDIAVRYGGEEFMVLRKGVPLATGFRWAERIRHETSELIFDFCGEPVSISASIGIYSDRSDLFSNKSIDRADQALYLAKEMGRNRTCSWELVCFNRIVRDTDEVGTVAKIQSVLNNSRDMLGPTQFEHLSPHSERVGVLARRIGRLLGLSDDSQARLQIAGLAHDLGKFLIPEYVLSKPTRLNSDEEYLLARHAEDSAEMLKCLGADVPTQDCVRNHHQRFDSDCGILGDRVPMNARILSVADALVAMTSDRPCQRARSTEAAAEELIRERGGQFDPVIVDALTTRKLQNLLQPELVGIG